MKYSVEQDSETGKWCVYENDGESSKKVAEFESRREATREMGRLQAESAKGGSAKIEDDKEDK